jgi:nucleoside-diphosphate-sugar epimerase
MRKRVLIIGGYGVFGSKLASGLIGAGGFDVIVAGR